VTPEYADRVGFLVSIASRDTTETALKKKIAGSILAATLALQLGCGHTESLTAPQATEPFPVTIRTRTPAQGETIPTIRAVAGPGSITITVTRVAMCATEVNAAVRRSPSHLDIVAHVWPNPGALCLASVSNAVVDYTGTVISLAPGPYLVRVFDGNTEGSPPFIGSLSISVPSP